MTGSAGSGSAARGARGSAGAGTHRGARGAADRGAGSVIGGSFTARGGTSLTVAYSQVTDIYMMMRNICQR